MQPASNESLLWIVMNAQASSHYNSSYLVFPISWTYSNTVFPNPESGSWRGMISWLIFQIHLRAWLLFSSVLHLLSENLDDQIVNPDWRDSKACEILLVILRTCFALSANGNPMPRLMTFRVPLKYVKKIRGPTWITLLVNELVVEGALFAQTSYGELQVRRNASQY